MQTIAYARPHVTDYGTLVEMTAHPDVNLVGSVGKVFLMAAMSLPISGGKVAGATGASTPGDVVNGLQPGEATHVLAGTGSGSGGTAAGGGGSGGGGGLPFTGFPALVLAALGAGLSMTGAMLRSKLRRQG